MLPVAIEIEIADQHDALPGTAENIWETTRLRLVGDVCDVDQSLVNFYAKHWLDGESRPLYTRGFYSIESALSRC